MTGYLIARVLRLDLTIAPMISSIESVLPDEAGGGRKNKDPKLFQRSPGSKLHDQQRGQDIAEARC